MKQVIVLRNDLNMRKGKMCAQAAHASISAMFASDGNPDWLTEWEETGSTKIVAYVKSLSELEDLYEKAREASLPRAIIEDSGRTEFKDVTITCIAIGPCPNDLIDKITGELPLL